MYKAQLMKLNINTQLKKAAENRQNLKANFNQNNSCEDIQL